MGEHSKKIGEIGENIAENFFRLLGWTPISQQSLACQKSGKHAIQNSKTGERKTHGIDFLFSYLSPLESSTVEHVIISVKHTEKAYASSPKSKFKEYIYELAKTLECYKYSEMKNEQQQSFDRATKSRDTGVLFWLSSNDSTYKDVVSRVSNIQLDDEFEFNTIQLIDNERISFLYDVLMYLRGKFNPENIYYYYPETALNYGDINISRSGKIFPVEFLTYPLIPFIIKAKTDEEQDIFCFAYNDKFNKDTLKKLISAAREYTGDISSKYLFLFDNNPSINELSEINKIKSQLNNETISRKIFVESYRPNVRSLTNEQ